MDKILKGVVKYNLLDKARFVNDIDKFTKKIVQPQTVFISCMDSRVLPSKFVHSAIGETFYVRNAGNMVPHHEDYLAGYISSEGGGLELGCIVNNIRNVVICGHSDCRALYALYDMRRNCDHKHHHPQSPLKTWVALNGRRSANRFSELFPDEVKRNNFADPVIFEVNLGQGLIKAFIDPENEFCIQDKLSQINCLEQASHVTTYPNLQEFIKTGELQIHAMWYDVYTGNVYLFSPSQRRFVIISDSNVASLLSECGCQSCAGELKKSQP
ncbi:hypothetical protein BsWGS_03468 [Bradybaena similaris]